MTAKLLLAVTGLLFLTFLNSNEIGDPCPDGRPGVCLNVYNCTSALINITLKIPPYHCSFEKDIPIVCCNDPHLLLNSRVPKIMTLSTTTASVKTGTTERIMNSRYEISKECTPISKNLTVSKIGQKAFDKCQNYHKKYYWGNYIKLNNEKFKRLENRMTARMNYCPLSHENMFLVAKGIPVYTKEFSHMALLGFGTTKVEWKCGGTIISERFVLTAAHCTKAPGIGSVTKIKIGILRLSEPDTNSNVYNVFKIHVHHCYHSPLKYNDIALLETDRNMLSNLDAIPACLHDGSEVSDIIIVTGWGQTSTTTKTPADILQKAFLEKFDDSECRRYYEIYANRNYPNGINTETQICFGNKNRTSGTCNGDSGGPAQIRHRKFSCMYLVIGVTSFGKSCGRQGSPGVYTKVSHYLSWIESIVWP